MKLLEALLKELLVKELAEFLFRSMIDKSNCEFKVYWIWESFLEQLSWLLINERILVMNVRCWILDNYVKIVYQNTFINSECVTRGNSSKTNHNRAAQPEAFYAVEIFFECSRWLFWKLFTAIDKCLTSSGYG